MAQSRHIIQSRTEPVLSIVFTFEDYKSARQAYPLPNSCYNFSIILLRCYSIGNKVQRRLATL